MTSFVSKHKIITKEIIFGFIDVFNMDSIEEKNIDGKTTSQRIFTSGHIVWRHSFKSNYSHLVVFPVFFNLLDLYIDEMHENLIDKNFKTKVEFLEGKTSIFEKILANIYKKSALIRNKLIHHVAIHNENDNIIIVKDGDKKEFKFEIAKFRILNELIFMIINYKTGNAFLRNSVFSAYSSLFEADAERWGEDALGEIPHALLASVESERYFKILSVSDNDLSKKIFDVIAVSSRSLWINATEEQKKSSKTLPEKIINCNFTYSIRCKDKLFLIPSELVYYDNKITFNQLAGWEF